MVLMKNEKSCDECGFVDPVTLHDYPGSDLGTFVHLCNRCVLEKNVHKFCIVCFDLLYEVKNRSWSSLPATDTKSDHATCICCPAKVHVRCLPSSSSSASSETTYFCPRCINTSSSNSFKFFDVKKPTAYHVDDEGRGYISWFSKDVYNQLYCAGKIAVADLGCAMEVERAWVAATAGKSMEETIRIRDELLGALRRMGINFNGGGSREQRPQQPPQDATLDLDNVAGDNNAAAADDDDAKDRDAAATDDDSKDRDAAAADDDAKDRDATAADDDAKDRDAAAADDDAKDRDAAAADDDAKDRDAAVADDDAKDRDAAATDDDAEDRDAAASDDDDAGAAEVTDDEDSDSDDEASDS